MRTVGDFFLIEVKALTFLQCSKTAGWVKRRESITFLAHKILPLIPSKVLFHIIRKENQWVLVHTGSLGKRPLRHRWWWQSVTNLIRSASSSAFICFCRRYRSRGGKYWYRFRLDSFCSSSIFNVLPLNYNITSTKIKVFTYLSIFKVMISDITEN